MENPAIQHPTAPSDQTLLGQVQAVLAAFQAACEQERSALATQDKNALQTAIEAKMAAVARWEALETSEPDFHARLSAYRTHPAYGALWDTIRACRQVHYHNGRLIHALLAQNHALLRIARGESPDPQMAEPVGGLYEKTGKIAEPIQATVQIRE